MSNPTDALPDWLLEEPAPTEPRRRPPRLLALAVLPWVVVLALVLPRPGTAPSPSPEHDQATSTLEPTQPAAPDAAADLPTPAPGDGLAPGPDPAPGPGDHTARSAHDPDGAAPAIDPDAEVLWALEHPTSYRLRPGPEEAAALAVAVARAWLTGLEPTLEVDGIAAPDAGRYAEHLVVEAVEPVGGDATVVTLLAVLLTPAAEHQDTGGIELRRLAVPVATTREGTRPAGTPWWLPEPTMAVLRPSLDAPLGAEERQEALLALERVGFAEVALDELHAVGPTVAVAAVRARTPGGEQVDGEVWLRRHLHGFAVTGAPLYPGRADEPQEATP